MVKIEFFIYCFLHLLAKKTVCTTELSNDTFPIRSTMMILISGQIRGFFSGGWNSWNAHVFNVLRDSDVDFRTIVCTDPLSTFLGDELTASYHQFYVHSWRFSIQTSQLARLADCYKHSEMYMRTHEYKAHYIMRGRPDQIWHLNLSWHPPSPRIHLRARVAVMPATCVLTSDHMSWVRCGSNPSRCSLALSASLRGEKCVLVDDQFAIMPIRHASKYFVGTGIRDTSSEVHKSIIDANDLILSQAMIISCGSCVNVFKESLLSRRLAKYDVPVEISPFRFSLNGSKDSHQQPDPPESFTCNAI